MKEERLETAHIFPHITIITVGIDACSVLNIGLVREKSEKYWQASDKEKRMHTAEP